MTEPNHRVTITIEAEYIPTLIDTLARGVRFAHTDKWLYACEALGAFERAAKAALSNEGTDVKAQLLEACQQAYDLIAGGCYHASPVANVLVAAIAAAKENT